MRTSLVGYFNKWLPHYRFIDDLNLEVLFDDHQVVAAGMSSPWAGRRRKIDLADLVDEPWILPEGPDSWNYRVVEVAFRTRGPRVPTISVMTFSIHLRIGLLASGRFITTLSKRDPGLPPGSAVNQSAARRST